MLHCNGDKIRKRRSYDPNLLYGMWDPSVQVPQGWTGASGEVLHRWDRSRLHTGRSHLSRMWTVLRSASNHPWPIGKQNHPRESLRAPVELKQTAVRKFPWNSQAASERQPRNERSDPNRGSWGLAPFINLENSDSANSQSNSMSCPGLSPDPVFRLPAWFDVSPCAAQSLIGL